MKFVSIDLETTGLDGRRHAILEFAAVAFDFDDPNYYEQFHAFIDSPQMFWDMDTLKFHRDRLDYFAEGRPKYKHGELFPAFRRWLETRVTIPVTVAGKNFGSFDLQFLKSLPGFRDDVFKYRYLDVGSKLFDPKFDLEIPGLNNCMLRTGIPSAVAHTAMEDALCVAAVTFKAYGYHLPKLLRF